MVTVSMRIRCSQGLLINAYKSSQVAPFPIKWRWTGDWSRTRGTQNPNVEKWEQSSKLQAKQNLGASRSPIDTSKDTRLGV